MSHMSKVMRQVSPVTCRLTTTLCSFSCYESPRMLGDEAEEGLERETVPSQTSDMGQKTVSVLAH